MTKEQQDEKDTIELGMLSIMQMHSNETGTEVAKNWKDTFADIYTFYQQEYMKSTDSEMIETEQENKETTEDIEFDDDDEDSDEYDSDYVETNKRRDKYSIFDDEEESDDPGTQNTLGKESGDGKIVGIDTKDANPTDNDASESGKANAHDANDKSETDAAGNNKRAGDDNLEEERGKRQKRSGPRKK
jgi:hypothetical protein